MLDDIWYLVTTLVLSCQRFNQYLCPCILLLCIKSFTILVIRICLYFTCIRFLKLCNKLLSWVLILTTQSKVWPITGCMVFRSHNNQVDLFVIYVETVRLLLSIVHCIDWDSVNHLLLFYLINGKTTFMYTPRNGTILLLFTLCSGWKPE